MFRRLLLLIPLFALGCAPSMASVTMNGQNDTGQDGTATLTQKGDDLEVKVTIKQGADTGDQPAHIHKGSCPGLGDIVKGLNPIVKGESTTILSKTRLDEVAGGEFVINVHNSKQGSLYVSCGVIP